MPFMRHSIRELSSDRADFRDELGATSVEAESW